MTKAQQTWRLFGYSIGLGILDVIFTKTGKGIWVLIQLYTHPESVDTGKIPGFILSATSDMSGTSFITGLLIAPMVENLTVLIPFVILFRWMKMPKIKSGKIIYCAIAGIVFGVIHIDTMMDHNQDILTSFRLYTSMISGVLMAFVMLKADKAGFKLSECYFFTVILHATVNATLLLIQVLYLYFSAS